MFSIDSGWSDMAWQMNPLPQGKEFHWNAPNYFFVLIILCPSQNIFQNSQFFSNSEPSEIYISLWCLYKLEIIEVYISVHIDLFTYFCVGMFGIDCEWSDMAWKMNPPSYLTKHSTDISVRWTPPKDLI